MNSSTFLTFDIPRVVLAVDRRRDLSLGDVREAATDQRVRLARDATELPLDALIKLDMCVVAIAQLAYLLAVRTATGTRSACRTSS